MTFEKPTLCNCDARGFNLTDEGTLSSDQLPIYGVQFGGSFTPFSNVKFNIGPLICSGKNGYYPSEAENVHKETLNSKMNDLTNDIAETKEDLQDLFDVLEDHLRTTTTTTTTTTYPRLKFEKIEPFRASSNNKIGEITTYYHNYEFSMEVKYDRSQLSKSSTQMLEGIVFMFENGKKFLKIEKKHTKSPAISVHITGELNFFTFGRFYHLIKCIFIFIVMGFMTISLVSNTKRIHIHLGIRIVRIFFLQSS